MKVKDDLAYDLQIIQLGWMLIIFDITELVLLTFSTNTNTMIIPITQLLETPSHDIKTLYILVFHFPFVLQNSYSFFFSFIQALSSLFNLKKYRASDQK